MSKRRGAWWLALVLVACRRDVGPTTPPGRGEGATVTTDGEPEVAGQTRIVTPGEGRSGLYATAPTEPRTKDAIRTVIREHISQVRACYEQGLARTPGLEGTVRVKFGIDEDGTVASVDPVDGFPDAVVERCIVDVTKALVFTPAPGSGVVTVSYPFVLRTSE